MKHLRAGAELAGLALRQSTQISQLQTERRGCAAVLRTASTTSACEPSASGRTPFALRQAVAAASGARQDGHEGQQDGRTLQAAPHMTGLAAAMLFTQTVAQCDADGSSPHAVVERIWQDVVNDLDRLAAQASQADATGLAKMTPPEVDASRPCQITVRVPVRQGVDVVALERALGQMYIELRDAFSPGMLKTSSISVHESQGAKQVTFQLQGCSVQLSAPRTQSPGSGDDSAAGAEPVEAPQGRVEIVRHSSQLDAQDLALLARVMQLSNDTSLKPLPPDDNHGSVPSSVEGRLRQGDEFAQLGAELDSMLSNEPWVRELEAMFVEHARRLQLEPHSQHAQADPPDRCYLPHAPQAGTAVAPRPPPPAPSPQADAQSSADAERRAAERAEARAAAQLKRKAQALRDLGAVVHLPEEGGGVEWESMAGYEEQKRAVEEIVLMSITHAEDYAAMAKRTRKSGTCERPKAVLFEGPPGTGKTTCARIVAQRATVPLVYIPLESVASKWYGESEQKLGAMLNQAEDLSGGCIIFLDEVDSLAQSRSSDMNEASRRLLSVLLRFVDGFKATNSIIVAATNRKQDLDAALLSRCDTIVSFPLPDRACRADILEHYAAHLSLEDLKHIADATDGMSARDLRAICEVAERRWVAAISQGREAEGSVPPLSAYLTSAKARTEAVRGTGTDTAAAPLHRSRVAVSWSQAALAAAGVCVGAALMAFRR